MRRFFALSFGSTGSNSPYPATDIIVMKPSPPRPSAVESTSDEVLLFAGEPAQALYSSTSGGRTRSVEDVFRALLRFSRRVPCGSCV